MDLPSNLAWKLKELPVTVVKSSQVITPIDEAYFRQLREESPKEQKLFLLGIKPKGTLTNHLIKQIYDSLEPLSVFMSFSNSPDTICFGIRCYEK